MKIFLNNSIKIKILKLRRKKKIIMPPEIKKKMNKKKNKKKNPKRNNNRKEPKKENKPKRQLLKELIKRDKEKLKVI